MLQNAAQLRELLHSIDHKGYPAYKSLKGQYQFDGYILSIDHVQGDPFASPSAVSLFISHKESGLPAEYRKSRTDCITLSDYLLRCFFRETKACSFQAGGSGKSGLIQVTRPGQEVLERTSCEITRQGICLRFFIGFPARGRTIQADELEKILFRFLPACVDHSLRYQNLDASALRSRIELARDQEQIRRILKEKNLIAFTANGSILPRESGISSLPMKNAVPFRSPSTLEITLHLPYAGEIRGMGLPAGITLIVGGGFHGKSTLLDALMLGVYNHIPGDGREFVITDRSAVKLLAENGRFVQDVDISLFIHDLPGGRDTVCFSTQDASGSTSQAASLSEAIEAGSKVFLMDEDTSAANFMVRDELMQQIVSREKEPITPFIERMRDLYEKAGISTVLAAGSSGAFFYTADTVLQMDHYLPRDLTAEVKSLLKNHPAPPPAPSPFRLPSNQGILTEPEGLSEGRDERDRLLKTKVTGRSSFLIGHDPVDLHGLEQLIDSEQTAALAYLLKYVVTKEIDGRKTLSEIVSSLMLRLEQDGFSALNDPALPAGLAVPRKAELYGCFSRLRRKPVSDVPRNLPGSKKSAERRKPWQEKRSPRQR